MVNFNQQGQQVINQVNVAPTDLGLIFRKDNLSGTFKALYARLKELQEASEWFDGSDGELEILHEIKMIQGGFDAYYLANGRSAVQYFMLDQ